MVSTTLDNVQTVQNFPIPTTAENVWSFLGLAGYYRTFIQNVAIIATPLTSFLKKNVPFQWNNTMQRSFDLSIYFFFIALTKASILAFPDFQSLLIICTNASAQDLGTVLMQQVEPHHIHDIAFGSRSLTHL